MSSTFSVIYTEYNIGTSSKVNYTLTGLDELILNGTWADVTYNVTGYDYLTAALVSYEVTIKAFIAYSPQVNGLDGIIGMAPVHMIEEL